MSSSPPVPCRCVPGPGTEQALSQGLGQGWADSQLLFAAPISASRHPPIPAVPAVLDLKPWRVLGSSGDPVETTAAMIQLPGPSSGDPCSESLGYRWECGGLCHRRGVPGLDLRNSTLRCWQPPLLEGPWASQRDTPRTSFVASPHWSLLPMNPTLPCPLEPSHHHHLQEAFPDHRPPHPAAWEAALSSPAPVPASVL